MNTKTRFALVITLALIAGAALVVVTWAAPMIAPTAPDTRADGGRLPGGGARERRALHRGRLLQVRRGQRAWAPPPTGRTMAPASAAVSRPPPCSWP